MEREVKRAVLIRIGPVCSVVFASLRNYPCSVFVSHDVSMYPPPRFIDIVIGRFAWNANPPFVDLPSQSSVFRQLFTRRSTTSSGGRGEGEGGVGSGEGWKFAQIFRNDKNFLSRFLHTYIYIINIYIYVSIYFCGVARVIIAATEFNVPPFRTVFLYFGIFFDFDAFTLFLAWIDKCSVEMMLLSDNARGRKRGKASCTLKLCAWSVIQSVSWDVICGGKRREE